MMVLILELHLSYEKFGALIQLFVTIIMHVKILPLHSISYV